MDPTHRNEGNDGDFPDWPLSQVLAWLPMVGLQHLEPALRRGNITGKRLVRLTDQHLVQLGIQDAEDRAQLLRAAAIIRSRLMQDQHELLQQQKLLSTDEAGGRLVGDVDDSGEAGLRRPPARGGGSAEPRSLDQYGQSRHSSSVSPAPRLHRGTGSHSGASTAAALLDTGPSTRATTSIRRSNPLRHSTRTRTSNVGIMPSYTDDRSEDGMLGLTELPALGRAHTAPPLQRDGGRPPPAYTWDSGTHHGSGGGDHDEPTYAHIDLHLGSESDTSDTEDNARGRSAGMAGYDHMHLHDTDSDSSSTQSRDPAEIAALYSTVNKAMKTPPGVGSGDASPGAGEGMVGWVGTGRRPPMPLPPEALEPPTDEDNIIHEDDARPGVRELIDEAATERGVYIGEHSKEEVVDLLGHKREGTYCVFALPEDDSQLYLALVADENVLMRAILNTEAGLALSGISQAFSTLSEFATFYETHFVPLPDNRTMLLRFPLNEQSSFGRSQVSRAHQSLQSSHIGQLEDYPWFYGSISRRDAACVLEYEEDGCFLVRVADDDQADASDRTSSASTTGSDAKHLGAAGHDDDGARSGSSSASIHAAHARGKTDSGIPSNTGEGHRTRRGGGKSRRRRKGRQSKDRHGGTTTDEESDGGDDGHDEERRGRKRWFHHLRPRRRRHRRHSDDHSDAEQAGAAASSPATASKTTETQGHKRRGAGAGGGEEDELGEELEMQRSRTMARQRSMRLHELTSGAPFGAVAVSSAEDGTPVTHVDAQVAAKQNESTVRDSSSCAYEVIIAYHGQTICRRIERSGVGVRFEGGRAFFENIEVLLLSYSSSPGDELPTVLSHSPGAVPTALDETSPLDSFIVATRKGGQQRGGGSDRFTDSLDLDAFLRAVHPANVYSPWWAANPDEAKAATMRTLQGRSGSFFIRHGGQQGSFVLTYKAGKRLHTDLIRGTIAEHGEPRLYLSQAHQETYETLADLVAELSTSNPYTKCPLRAPHAQRQRAGSQRLSTVEEETSERSSRNSSRSRSQSADTRRTLREQFLSLFRSKRSRPARLTLGRSVSPEGARYRSTHTGTVHYETQQQRGARSRKQGKRGEHGAGEEAQRPGSRGGGGGGGERGKGRRRSGSAGRSGRSFLRDMTASLRVSRPSRDAKRRFSGSAPGSQSNSFRRSTDPTSASQQEEQQQQQQQEPGQQQLQQQQQQGQEQQEQEQEGEWQDRRGGKHRQDPLLSPLPPDLGEMQRRGRMPSSSPAMLQRPVSAGSGIGRRGRGRPDAGGGLDGVFRPTTAQGRRSREAMAAHDQFTFEDAFLGGHPQALAALRESRIKSRSEPNLGASSPAKSILKKASPTKAPPPPPQHVRFVDKPIVRQLSQRSSVSPHEWAWNQVGRSRAQAARALRGMPSGAFVVRRSESKPTNFAITYVYGDALWDELVATNAPSIMSTGAFYLESAPHMVFTSFFKLLRYYCNDDNVLACRLRLPASFDLSLFEEDRRHGAVSTGRSSSVGTGPAFEMDMDFEDFPKTPSTENVHALTTRTMRPSWHGPRARSSSRPRELGSSASVSPQPQHQRLHRHGSLRSDAGGGRRRWSSSTRRGRSRTPHLATQQPPHQPQQPPQRHAHRRSSRRQSHRRPQQPARIAEDQASSVASSAPTVIYNPRHVPAPRYSAVERERAVAATATASVRSSSRHRSQHRSQQPQVQVQHQQQQQHRHHHHPLHYRPHAQPMHSARGDARMPEFHTHRYLPQQHPHASRRQPQRVQPPVHHQPRRQPRHVPPPAAPGPGPAPSWLRGTQSHPGFSHATMLEARQRALVPGQVQHRSSHSPGRVLPPGSQMQRMRHRSTPHMTTNAAHALHTHRLPAPPAPGRSASLTSYAGGRAPASKTPVVVGAGVGRAAVLRSPRHGRESTPLEYGGVGGVDV